MGVELSSIVANPRPPLPPGPYVVAGLRRAGLAAARALLDRHSVVYGWDAERTSDSVAAADELRARGAAIDFEGDGTALLDAAGTTPCLVKSPGVPFTSPLIAGALARGLTVLDEAELGWRLDRRPMFAVTGTNGKGTTAAALAAALAGAGAKPLVAGNTHFGPPLSAAVQEPGNVIVAELSSFQLAGSPALLPEASVFTNIGQQHWDYHGSRAAYVAAKRRMFVRGDRAVGVAALNVDDEDGLTLADEVEARGGRVASYGTRPDAAYRILACDWSLQRSVVRIATPNGERTLESRLAGHHNAMNLTAALAVVEAAGLGSAAARAALAATEPLPGRFEPVVTAQPFALIVDFAHNPEGVRAVLTTARQLVDRRDAGGRLLALVAPLWTHDPEMRQATLRAARDLADHVVLATQRWRPEEPLAPPPDVLAAAEADSGCACTIIADRAAAIERLVSSARAGDAVLILGRGEGAFPLYDERGNAVAFDDRAVAAAAASRWDASA